MPSISIKQDGGSASVIIDGVEISHGLRGIDISMKARSLTRLTPSTRVTLDVLIAEDFQMDTKGAIVVIPEATAATLKALGWTAPEATS
jgi:hypothetical protein